MIIEVLFALIVDATFFTGKHRLEWMGLLHVFIYKLKKILGLVTDCGSYIVIFFFIIVISV